VYPRFGALSSAFPKGCIVSFSFLPQAGGKELMDQHKEKRPNRKKARDYPYELHVRDGKYFVSFKNVHNQLVEVELTYDQFCAFDEFELHNKKEQNEWDRHLEHSEQSEPTLMRRKARYEPSLEEKMLDEIERQERKSEFIRVSSRYLTKTQRRRLYRYYYQNLTYEEIAKKESVHLTTVKESIDAAIEILRKHLKSDQAN
jgi:RNA polymerase sigma-70 factor (ECF subfamily)